MAFSVGAIGLSVYNYISRPKIAFVDFMKLYEGYNGKIELQKKLTDLKSKQDYFMDSLSVDIKMIESKGKATNAPDYIDKVNRVNRIYREFEDKNKKIEQTYINQVVNQINGYVTEYGAKQHYDLILGANGNGSIMYAAKPQDITDEVLKYINQKYEGK